MQTLHLADRPGRPILKKDLIEFYTLILKRMTSHQQSKGPVFNLRGSCAFADPW